MTTARRKLGLPLLPLFPVLFAAASAFGAASCSSTSTGEGVSYTAQDLATAKQYQRLVFEVDAVPGFEPRTDALDELRSQLDGLRASGHLGKPAGIDIVVDTNDALPRAPSADHAYTSDELEALSRDHLGRKGTSTEAVVHVLYVDGHSADDSGGSLVLGVAYEHALLVVFKATLEAGCASPSAKSKLVRTPDTLCSLTEQSVLVHETGHLLGLVNRGLPMVAPHQDDAHGKHDANDQCVMFFASETSSLVPFLLDRISRGNTKAAPFDEACLADLAAAQTEK
jgi:hypothetical protein